MRVLEARGAVLERDFAFGVVRQRFEPLGRASWWMPKWLDRLLPRISIEGEEYFAEQDAGRGALEPVTVAP